MNYFYFLWLFLEVPGAQRTQICIHHVTCKKHFLSSPRHNKVHGLSSVEAFWLGDSPHKGQVEANRQLEVELNGCTLVVTSNCIFDLNVNLQQRKKKIIIQVFQDLRVKLTLCFAESIKNMLQPWDHKKPRLQGWVSMAPQTHSGCFQVAVKHIAFYFNSKQQESCWNTQLTFCCLMSY